MSMIIGIAGGSGSGKTTLANKIFKSFPNRQFSILSQDSYYIDQSDRFDHDGGAVNFDHPDSIDFSLLAMHLKQLKQNKPILVPQYDFKTHKRLKTTIQLIALEFTIVEGTLLFHNSDILDNLDLKIFLDVPEEVRFQRRLKRDVELRGREPKGIKEQFLSQVKPMHDMFVEPTKRFADLVIKNDDYDQCLTLIKQNLFM